MALPQPDFPTFRRVILGEEKPRRVHFVELLFDEEPQAALAARLGIPWVLLSPETAEAFWRNTVALWCGLGYDYVRVSRGISFTSQGRSSPAAPTGSQAWVEEGQGIIRSREDFEKYPWPQGFDRRRYEIASQNLPEGMGMMVSPCAGVFETVSEKLLGFEGMSHLAVDDPELLGEIFAKVGSIFEAFYREVVKLDGVGGFFQGEDLGYKTSLLVSPAFLRRHVFPWHRKYAEIAHGHGKMFWFHSCGNVAPIMEDLIADVKIDAFHSFQDEIKPVVDFSREYGERMAALGGVDVDKLCRLPEPELRTYVRSILDACMPGRFALGTGNSVTRYVPLDNYLAMLDVGRQWA